jgi:hypothetical protein
VCMCNYFPRMNIYIYTHVLRLIVYSIHSFFLIVADKNFVLYTSQMVWFEPHQKGNGVVGHLRCEQRN